MLYFITMLWFNLVYFSACTVHILSHFFLQLVILYNRWIRLIITVASYYNITILFYGWKLCYRRCSKIAQIKGIALQVHQHFYSYIILLTFVECSCRMCNNRITLSTVSFFFIITQCVQYISYFHVLLVCYMFSLSYKNEKCRNIYSPINMESYASSSSNTLYW